MERSELNPDAPEFQPNAKLETPMKMEEEYNYVNTAIKTSNTFPIGVSHDLYQTYPDFNVVITQLQQNAVSNASLVIQVERPVSKLHWEQDDESNVEQVVDINDSMLDRLNSAMDSVNGEWRARAGPVGVVGSVTSSWNNSPTLHTLQMKGNTVKLLGAKNIPRPQLSFKEPVDNSDSLFKPRIQEKPNSIEPLALTMLFDKDGKPTGYEHPYKAELTMYSPPAWAMEDVESPTFPLPLEGTPLTMVDTEAALDALVSHLETVQEIAVDLEHHSYRTYLGITCVMQITTDTGGDFIVDTLAVRDYAKRLLNAFTDPNIIKVFHGADNDVMWLQRDLGLYVVGMFDTHQAARLLQLDGASLKHMLKRYCDIDADKTHQLADWRMRPLPAELVKYARADTHYLLYVYRRMRHELLARGPDALATTFHNSKQICLRTYTKPTIGAESHLIIYQNAGKRFTTAQMTALRTAWSWRDRHARELDESPAYLVPDHMLLAVAEMLPRDMQGLRALCELTPPFLHHHMAELHSIILASREVVEEPVVFPMPANLVAMVPLPRDASRVPQDWFWEHDNGESFPEKGKTGAKSSSISVMCTPPGSSRGSPQHDSPDLTNSNRPNLTKVSTLNAEAILFVPPYDRYKAYRVLSQGQELRAMRAKEAKVKAIARGNQLICKEVLEKMVEPEEVSSADTPPQSSPPHHHTFKAPEMKSTSPEFPPTTNQDSNSKQTQRKRKWSDKRKQKQAGASSEAEERIGIYGKVNYKKFYTKKSHKEH